MRLAGVAVPVRSNRPSIQRAPVWTLGAWGTKKPRERGFVWRMGRRLLLFVRFLDHRGLRPLGTHLHVEFDFLVLRQGSETLALDH